MNAYVWAVLVVFCIDAASKIYNLARDKPVERTRAGIALDLAGTMFFFVWGVAVLATAP